MSSFRGVGTALITPFTESGALDEAALQKFVDWQIAEGVNFLVPCGTTGENPTLTADEHARVVQLTQWPKHLDGVACQEKAQPRQRCIALQRSLRQMVAFTRVRFAQRRHGRGQPRLVTYRQRKARAHLLHRCVETFAPGERRCR